MLHPELLVASGPFRDSLALNHGQPLLSRPGRAAPRTAIPWIPWRHRPVGGEATSERLGGCGHCARQQPGELQREDQGDQGDQGGSQGLPQIGDWSWKVSWWKTGPRGNEGLAATVVTFYFRTVLNSELCACACVCVRCLWTFQGDRFIII